MLVAISYVSFALPSITYVSPTLQDNATTNVSWAYINITSDEDLNQSLLEWGNSGGFTNITMENSSMANWHVNVSGLVNGMYNYTVWAENTIGEWSQTEMMQVIVNICAESCDVAPPSCSDEIQNQDETDVDCGGVCDACITEEIEDPEDIINLSKNYLAAYSSNAETSVNITFKSAINNPLLTISRVSNIYSFEVPQNPVYKYIIITKINFQDTDIENATIGFKVNKSWLASNSVSSAYLSKYSNGWTRLTTNLVDSGAEYNNYIAYTDGFSYFAIIGENAPIIEETAEEPESQQEPIPDMPLTEEYLNASNTSGLEASGLENISDNSSNRAPQSMGYLSTNSVLAIVIVALAGGIYYYGNYAVKAGKNKMKSAEKIPIMPSQEENTPKKTPILPLQQKNAPEGYVERWFPNICGPAEKNNEPSEDSNKKNTDVEYLIRRLKEARDASR